MGRPQQPELARSGKTDLDPDHVETTVKAQRGRRPTVSGSPGDAPGPIPEGNRPGHHPEREQDQPDATAVAARLGVPPANRVERVVVTLATAPLRLTNRALGALLRRLEGRR